MPAMMAARPQAQRAQQAAPPPLPFTAAAHEHTEPMLTDNAGSIGAAQIPRGPYNVPAYGFMRHIFMEVAFSGGTLGAGVIGPDGMFAALQNLMLADVNGAPIYGPLDGYAAMWSNIIGGYSYRGDPRLYPWYSNTINGAVGFRVPVEISRHNAYGALANQNSAAAYQLSYNIGTSAQVFSTAPTTPPAVQVKLWLEAWSQPAGADLLGRPQQRDPAGHGTTQFWSAFTKTGLAAGNFSVPLTRVGNLVRALMFIARDNTGARSDSVMPDPIMLAWDARFMRNESQRYHIANLSESFVNGVTRDTGVFAFAFDDFMLGKIGDEDPNLWLPTMQSTRLEVDGVSTTAGTLQVVTNDIAPVEVRPDERYVESSATGFHPVT